MKKIIKFLFKFLPVKLQVIIEYRYHCKRRLNFKRLERYSEKIQLYKLKYKNPILPIIVDKARVRDYVKDKGLEHILNDVYGVYNKVNEIDFQTLPDKFVIKLNTGSGRNIFVEDKNKINIDETKKTLKKWMKINPRVFGAEWPYKKVKPKIIIEKYLDRDVDNDLPDFKFFAFNGEIDYLYVMVDYIDDHKNGKLSFYDMEFNKTEYYRKDYLPITSNVKKPKNFDLMVEYAKILSKDFPHIRVDFYNIDGEIIFGELTLYTSKGYINFIPDNFDFILGDKFNINSFKR